MASSDILNRYDMTLDNKSIVHADLLSYAALFENDDYTSSFHKRDVNEKLAAGMRVLVLAGLSRCFFRVHLQFSQIRL